jgi:hypothetical protein
MKTRHVKPIINLTLDGYWCPGCKKERPVGSESGLPAVLCPWIAPGYETVACVYGACLECYERVMKKSPAGRQKFMDAVEEALLEKYPVIKDNLPPDYKPGDSDTAIL